MAKYGADVLPCCESCDSKEETKVCKKCHVVFCKHYASVTDQRFCGNCLGDFHLRETIMEKVVEHLKPNGTVSFSRKFMARHITLQGTDWLFAAHLIEEMDDAEIDATIEYHRANVGLMIQERESRKLERIRKLAGIKINTSANESQEAREKRLEKEANKKTRTRTKEKETTPEMLAAMLTTLAKAGLTKEQIVAMLGGKK